MGFNNMTKSDPQGLGDSFPAMCTIQAAFGQIMLTSSFRGRVLGMGYQKWLRA